MEESVVCLPRGTSLNEGSESSKSRDIPKMASNQKSTYKRDYIFNPTLLNKMKLLSNEKLILNIMA